MYSMSMFLKSLITVKVSHTITLHCYYYNFGYGFE